MTQYDIAILWLASLFAGLTAVAARISYQLFGVGEQPPEDLAALAAWKRKRVWLVISDLTALPAFATAGVCATIYFNLPPVASVLLSMVGGALGFGFLLQRLQIGVLRKLNQAQTEEPPK
jgi:uncharacterized membrane protein YeiH